MENDDISAEEQQAIDLEESGETTAALDIWARLAKKTPNAGFYCRAGGALQSLGRFQESEAAFRSAIALDPEFVEASLGLGLSLIKQNEFAEAVNALSSRAVLAESPIANDLLGIALMELDRYDEALQSFRKATELDPTMEEAFFNIGWLLRSTDEIAAQSAFSKAIELDSNYSSALRELGWLERKAEKLALAEQHLRRATELNPGDAWAWVYLGNLLWRLGKFSDAEDAFQSAYDHSQNEWYPNWELACFYEDGKDYERAARFYHKALLASSDQHVLLYHYGRFLLRQGDREGAEKYLRRAHEAEPGYEDARRLLEEVTGST